MESQPLIDPVLNEDYMRRFRRKEKIFLGFSIFAIFGGATAALFFISILVLLELLFFH